MSLKSSSALKTMKFSSNGHQLPQPVIGRQLPNTADFVNGKDTQDNNYTHVGFWDRTFAIEPLNNENAQLQKKISMAEKELLEAVEVNKQLCILISNLQSQLDFERNKTAGREVSGCPASVYEDPFVGAGDGNAGNLRYSPPGPVSPVAVHNSRVGRNSRAHHPPSAVSYTPTTQQASRDPPKMGATPASGRRHKRTETPEQLFLKPYTKGVPIYTMGIDPQNTRGLLHDFFEDIRKWVGRYANDLDDSTVAEVSKLPDLVDMFAQKTDIQHMLADKEMCQDVVAAMINRHMVIYAIGENFVYNSKHSAGDKCNQLFLDFAHLAEEEYALKHQVCLKQRALYTKLTTDPLYHDWRTAVAEDRCKVLLSKMAVFMKPGVYPEREHVLSELYVKGYRIGFRLRMDAVKWQIMWPVAGVEVNFKWMVNQTRNLYGDPATTYQKVTQDPTKYFVRFAVTPTFTCSDFSSGVEEKTVAHSALVHVGRRGVFSHHEDRKV